MHRSGDVGQQEVAAASRAEIVDNLIEARAFGSLLRKTTRLATQMSGLRIQDPDRWSILHDQLISLHADLEQRISTGQGNSLATFQERFNALQQRFQSGE